MSRNRPKLTHARIVRAKGGGPIRTILEHNYVRATGSTIPYHPYLMKQVGLDPAKDFIISLDEINALTHEFFVQYIYDKHEGLGAVPARVWHYKLMINRRRVIRTDALDHTLGRVEDAVLTPSGITFTRACRWSRSQSARALGTSPPRWIGSAGWPNIRRKSGSTMRSTQHRDFEIFAANTGSRSFSYHRLPTRRLWRNESLEILTASSAARLLRTSATTWKRRANGSGFKPIGNRRHNSRPTPLDKLAA
jgi:hypothetical protein